MTCYMICTEITLHQPLTLPLPPCNRTHREKSAHPADIRTKYTNERGGMTSERARTPGQIKKTAIAGADLVCRLIRFSELGKTNRNCVIRISSTAALATAAPVVSDALVKRTPLACFFERWRWVGAKRMTKRCTSCLEWFLELEASLPDGKVWFNDAIVELNFKIERDQVGNWGTGIISSFCYVRESFGYRTYYI